MTETRAEAARLAIIRDATAMGIDRAYISVLVDSFYVRVRRDAELGPVFEQAIGGRWEPHLARMKDFWESVALNAGVYSGKPVAAHRRHDTLIQEQHFSVWLALFRDTLEETAPTPEATDYFKVRANRIAESLKLAVFGVPGLGKPRKGVS